MITCTVLAAVVVLFVLGCACYQLSSPAGTAYPGASPYGIEEDGSDDDAGGDGGGEA
ncbi:hypothetical protein ACQP2E_17560 [Actinoplanes sp. CA-015351]|uniref:hypothetical protein n=1 Tax=Actinoplanes sp. CA-015351 TaxID=3239897 RepID=UPI003D9816B1